MTFSDLKLRLRALFGHRRAERELTEEIDFHRAMSARAGQRAAIPDVWVEQCRDARGLRWLEDLARDLRLALRRLRQAPGFALVAVVTLTLGIGANTAIFTLVDALMLRPLPVPHADRLVLFGAPDFTGMESGTADHNVDALTYRQYVQLRDQSHAFSGLAAFAAFEPTFQVDWAGAASAMVGLKFVSTNYFEVLGLTPARGRFFDAGATAQAVASYQLWRGDPGILGRTVRLHDAVFTVVGVAPPGFTGTTVGQAPGLYVPIALQPRVFPGSDWRNDPPGVTRRMWLLALGRLRPGATVAEARAEANVIFAESVRAQAELARNASHRCSLLTQYVPVAGAALGVSEVREEFAQPLAILMVLAGLVLVVVIVNLGGMLLEQAAGREREFAMRLALGAGRGRLVRQMLAESLLLAAMGGVAGWWLALWGERGLVALVAAGDNTLALPLVVDARMLAFTTAICLLAGIGFGLAPALRLSRVNLAARAASREPRAAGAALVVAQAALAIVLVTGAALFLRSLGQLHAVPLGYSIRNLESFNVNVATAGVPNARTLEIYQDLARATARLPGVRAVTFSENGLFNGTDSSNSVTVPGYAAGAAGARNDRVAPGYFAALGVPLLAGREFTPADAGRGVAPVIIDSVFAAKYFGPDRSPLGKLITLHFSFGDQVFEIVGVSAKAVQGDLRTDAARPRLYFDIANGYPSAVGAVAFLIRTAPGFALTRAQVDPMVAQLAGTAVHVNSMGAVSAALDITLAPDLLLVKLAGFFGLLALALAALGLYAMLSYGLARRRAEMAIRMALGARGGQVVGMVVRQALVLLGAGVAIGVGASLLLDRGLASLLYHVAPADPTSLAGAGALLLAGGFAAALLPALRASRTDPARILRSE